MKLYSLTLQAIGPFASTHHIDFAALGQSGIFLLEGPTGAGKSTIIDAVVFALYGDLAGESASKERLHSHHADRGVEPFVEVIFEVNAGMYRVRRSPAHQRPKRRGDGFTTQNESVTLSRLTDIDAPESGVPISTSTQEAGHEISRLIGLRKDQFLQTVVLPQGEFARFLRANGEDRKELLQTIFRTEIYEQMTKALVEMRRGANAQTESARHDLREAVAVLASAADVESDYLMAPDGAVDSQRVDELVTSASVEADDAARAADLTGAARAEAGLVLAAAERLTAGLQRRSALLVQQAQLADQQIEVTAAAEQVAVAQRAAVVAGAVRALDASEVALDRAGAVLAEAHSVVGATLTDGECAERDEQLGRRLVQLESCRAIEASFPVREQQLELIDEQVAGAEVRLAEIDKRMAELPVRREALQLARAHQASLADGLSGAQTACDQAEAVLKSAVLVVDKQAQGAAAKSTLVQLTGAAQLAVTAHAQLRLRRLRGMAGELAGALVSGSPCSVCGSCEHPQPATRPDDHPDDEAMDRAETAAMQAEADVVAARSVVDKLDAEVVFARQTSGQLAIEDAQAALDDAQTTLAAVQLAAARVNELDVELKSLERAELDDERERGQTNAVLSQARAELTMLSTSLADDRAKLAEQLSDEAESLAHLVEQLTRERRGVQRYAAAMRDQRQEVQRRAEAADALAEQLLEHGFANADEVRLALLPADEAAALEHLVATHRQQKAVVQAGLAASDIADLVGDEDPQLDQAREVALAAREADQLAAAAAGTATAQATKIHQRRDALTTAQEGLDTVAADAAAVIRMAEVADGTARANLKHLTLGTYVLMRRFEDVVAAANARLGPMSDGRYQLRATDEKERGARGRRTGLALAVLDTETGQEREPRTLSGGETFYVSLCLALGLADVVTAEAGGIEISTLFVDEGFGTLDPQTLDDVMAELTTLARGGRVIGIVSHVEDLKLRVADRIEVRRRDDGSSTLTVKV